MSSILFKELNISEELKAAVADMGFEETTLVQEKSIVPIIEGKDLVAQAPTGTGKTCAFGIPLIECTKQESEYVSGLVLCPTRELCMQTNEELMKLSKFKKGIRIVPIYGGQDFNRQLYALKRHPQIIVATPGRLMDHMRRHTISLENLEFMVLDEADEMLNMGFREDLDTILKSVPDTRQTMLFSATISPDIMAITKKYQKNAVSINVKRKDVGSKLIEQYYTEVKNGTKLEALTRIMDAKDYKTCMVFCNTKRMVDQLTEQLLIGGYRADAIHGDMKQAQRDKVMGKFKNHSIDMLIATDVAARGIDVDGIEAIFNFDLPMENEYYIHRIGRTGRANKTGVSYSFVQRREMSRLREIMKYASCTIMPYKIPSASDVKLARSNKIFDEIKELISTGKQKKYADIILKYVEESNEDITALDIAAALMQRADSKNSIEASGFEVQTPKERTDRVQPEKVRKPNEDSVRMFINVGTLDKINRRNMLDLFKLFTNIDVRRISSIDIFDKYSFVNIPSEETDNVINSLSDAEYKGRTVAIEVAQKTERKQDRRQKRTSNGRKR